MKKHKLFYGYWIIVVTFLCLAIQSGAGIYAFSLFYKPLQAEFDWGRGAISAAFTICFIVHGLASPFIGRMVDHYGARKVISLGALITGLGFLWLTLMQNLWSFYAGYVVIGLGMTAIGPIPTTQVVSNWFTKRRGLAIGMMSTGIGIGGLVLAPLVGAYLIPSFGWRASYLAIAVLTWVLIIPTALLVIKARPADIGLYPDGLEAAEATAEANLTAQASEGWALNMALKTSTFWLITVAFTVANFNQLGIIQHQVNHLTDTGFPLATAATALGAVGLFSAIGKFGFGWLCDQMPAKHAASISYALQIAAIIMLISLKPTSPLAMIWLYAIVMGLGVGGWMPTMSILISANFGLASYGAIFGMVSLVHYLGGAFGPLVAGQMFDVMQTYYWVFIIFLVLYTVAISLMLAVRHPKLCLTSSD